MSFLQYKEVRFAAAAITVFSLAGMTAGIMISTAAFFIILALSLALTGVFVICTRRRHKRITALCDLIDITLYTDKELDLDLDSKGELALLKTKVQKMAAKLREQDKFLQQEKKYMTDFVADISRQLRIPLTSINIVASFLAAGNLSPERHQELVEELNNLLTTTNWLVTTLLKIYRLDAGTANFRNDNIEVRAVLERALKPLSLSLKKKNIAVTMGSGPIARFHGDIAWSAEAIGNIIKNILEYADCGNIDISFTENSEFTQIMIRDDGTGFDKTGLSQLFKRSYQGKSVLELSIGAGLALSRMIIARHNGTVTAENLTNGGACYTIKFYQPASTKELLLSYTP